MKIGISHCLLGECCTYRGDHNRVSQLDQYQDIEWIPICPEVLGGLPIPRFPAEIKHNHPLLVETIDGQDVTKEYQLGAQKALKILKDHDVKIVLCKHRSPSCGSDGIYDGTFSHHIIEGQGVFASLLLKNNLIVFHEEQINSFLKYIGKEEE